MRSQGPGFQLPVSGSVPETEGTGELKDALLTIITRCCKTPCKSLQRGCAVGVCRPYPGPYAFSRMPHATVNRTA